VPLLPGFATSDTASSENAVVEASSTTQPPATTPPEATQPSQPEQVAEPETPQSDTVTASEVALTPIPLGLGFQSVANAVLTLAVGFVSLGILILGGFVFWRMYKRRID
jgi:hypothetical protein